jgi:hypothetical protein
MDTNPFTIRFLYHDDWLEAEIKPCCKEDSIVDYAVWMRNKLEFTVTKDRTNPGDQWVVALQNADDTVDPVMVQTIGREIDLKK